ncbi:minor tail protein [Rhodococcus phage GuyFagieri]|nr:minor tail protein [Rhodococcus phage GuyFagieri]
MVTMMSPPRADNRIIQSWRTEMTIEVRRGMMELEGYVNDHIEAEFEFVENETAPGHIEVGHKSKWASIFKRCDKENIFVHAFVNGKLWTGRVDRCRKRKRGKVKTVIAELVSDYVWLEAIMAWGAPFAPLGFQLPKKDVKWMATDTMIRTYLFNNLFRLQASLHKFPVGFFNNPLENGWWNVEKWMQPCVVLPSNPLFDTTRWNTLLARMTPMDQLFKEVLRDEHLVLTATAFVPGRDPQPSRMITLTKPCIVFDILDKRGVVGRTGTIFDGLFNTIIDTIDPIVGGVIGAFTADSDKYSLAKFFGTDPKDPWVVIREDMDDDIEESETIINSPQAHTAIVGGKSPDWLNKGVEMVVNAAIQGLLSAVGIGFLGDLISGELNDILLAFQSVTDNRMREQFGIFTLPEAYETSGTTAYTWDSAQALRKLAEEIRPYRTHTVTIKDGKPFVPFKHFDVGDPIGWEDDDEIYVDYVRRIVVTDNRKSRARVAITIGDEEATKSGLDKSLDRIGKMKQAFDFWTLSDD